MHGTSSGLFIATTVVRLASYADERHLAFAQTLSRTVNQIVLEGQQTIYVQSTMKESLG